MRQRWVIGNWKMTRGEPSVRDWLSVAAAQPELPGVRSAVAVPAPYLYLARDCLAGSPVGWGAQDVSWDDDGAHTGEVSASMLHEFGSTIVVVGHSERRLRFGENNEQVAAKAMRALACGISPVVCVGELAAERNAGKAEDVVSAQIEGLLAGLQHQTDGLLIAYEPIWAIGTGVAASPEQAQDMHALIRRQLGGTGKTVPLLYGGSVTADNAAGLFEAPDIDGALVGGASRRVDDFFTICAAASCCDAH